MTLTVSLSSHVSSHWGILPPPTCPQRVTERPLYFTLSVCTVCLRVCYQTRRAPKGQHAPLSSSCPSLFPPQETQITQFVCDLRFKASPLVNRYSWNFFVEGFAVSLSRDAGRLTALMAIKISGRMLTLEKATGNGRGWKREFTT